MKVVQGTIAHLTIAILLFAIVFSSVCNSNVSAASPASPASVTESERAAEVGRLLDGSVNVVVSFNTRNTEQLQSLIDSANTKAAVGERKPLTEEQFETNYSPNQMDYDRVIQFLTENNIRVTQTWTNRLLLLCKGEVTNVERVFNTEIDVFQYHNMTFYMNSNEAVVPALKELGVAGIEISNVTMEPAIKLRDPATPLGTTRNAPTHADPIASNPSPTDLRNAYGSYDAINHGYAGAGETIGIVDAYGDYDSSGNSIITSDVATFNSYYSLPSLNLIVQGTGGYGPAEWRGETALDVEWAHAMAPDATIILQLCQSDDSGALFGAVNSLVQLSNPPNAISLSWGQPESVWIPSIIEIDLYSAIFLSAASKGIEVYVASHDYGAKYEGSLAVWYPASDPNVIAVGGTTLYYNVVSGTKVFSETGWSRSGGGYSTAFPEPAYQVSAGIPDSTGTRAVPDVALDADPSSGVTIIQGGSYVYNVGGTSLATPLMAGIDAVSLSAYHLHLDNAHLYSLYKTSNYNVAFRDITSGNNGYYNAGSGWDAVTGLGSINLLNFAIYACGMDFTIGVSPSSGSVGPGGVAIATVAVTSVNGFSNPVSLSISIGSARGTKLYYYMFGVAGRPASYGWTTYYYGVYWSPVPGVTYILLATASISPTLGISTFTSVFGVVATGFSGTKNTYTVTITGTGGPRTHTCTYALTVS